MLKEECYKLKKDKNAINGDYVYCAKIIDNEAYIVLDYGKHYSAEDIGWRYSYKRLKTIYFNCNIKTDEITEIY